MKKSIKKKMFFLCDLVKTSYICIAFERGTFLKV